MFIHEMTDAECRKALERTHVGRLACARDNQPYVVPVHFAFDDGHIYGFTTLGQKIEWLRSNPLVCFEIDEVVSDQQWISIIVFGRYEELPDNPKYEAVRKRALAFLQERVMWWEPAYIAQEHRDQLHSLTPIFYRIHIFKMTGHRATSNGSQTDNATNVPASARKQAQLDEPAGLETMDMSIRARSLNTLRAAVEYFALVFGAGFVFGPIRILLAVPRFGERVAELLEAPLMLIVTVLAAKWIVRRFQIPPGFIQRFAVGFLALSLGLLFEFAAVLKLRGLTLTEYFQTRDPVSGTVYYLTLLLFGLMPSLIKLDPRIKAKAFQERITREV